MNTNPIISQVGNKREGSHNSRILRCLKLYVEWPAASPKGRQSRHVFQIFAFDNFDSLEVRKSFATINTPIQISIFFFWYPAIMKWMKQLHLHKQNWKLKLTAFLIEIKHYIVVNIRYENVTKRYETFWKVLFEWIFP